MITKMLNVRSGLLILLNITALLGYIFIDCNIFIKIGLVSLSIFSIEIYFTRVLLLGLRNVLGDILTIEKTDV